LDLDDFAELEWRLQRDRWIPFATGNAAGAAHRDDYGSFLRGLLTEYEGDGEMIAIAAPKRDGLVTTVLVNNLRY
jgi:hypothetical protein